MAFDKLKASIIDNLTFVYITHIMVCCIVAYSSTLRWETVLLVVVAVDWWTSNTTAGKYSHLIILLYIKNNKLCAFNSSDKYIQYDLYYGHGKELF